MSVISIIDAIQQVNAGIPGVKSAPLVDETPDTLEGANLPAAVTWAGPATWSGGGGLGSARKSQRTYVIQYYIAAKDAPASEVFPTMHALLEAVGLAWRDIAIVGGATVLHGKGFTVNSVAAGVEDLGVLRETVYAGVHYYGFEFRLPVQEMA